MKHVLLSIFFVLISLSFALAQIPNAGFENWTGSNPDQWLTNNAVPPYPIIQTADVHSGTNALEGIVVSLYTVAYPPLIISGANGHGFPLNYRPTSLHGFYKTSLVSGDTFYVYSELYKAGTPVGYGASLISANYGSYTELVQTINYITGDVPDTMIITMGISQESGPHTGSYFYLDDLSLSPAMGVSEHQTQVPAAFSLSQNYPNPFNPTTAISYALPVRGQVRLEVFNVLGERVAILVNTEKEAGYYTVNWTPKTGSGMYFYRMQSGSYTAVGKMVLAK